MPDCDPTIHAAPYVKEGEVTTSMVTTCRDPSTEKARNWVVRVWLRNIDQGERLKGSSDIDVRKQGNPVEYDEDDTNVDKPCQTGTWVSRIRIVMERFLFHRVIYDMYKIGVITSCSSEE